MPPRGPRIRRERGEPIRTLALVVRRVPVGDADLMVTLLTREKGLLSVSARAARRANCKLGVIEPMHTLRIVAEAGASEVAKLKESRIERVRTSLLDTQGRLDAAAKLLTYGRRTFVPSSAEPRAFDVIDASLDALAEADEPAQIESITIWGAAHLLVELGYGMELDACVRCGRACPADRPAYVDPAAGGLVCRTCGGAQFILSSSARARLVAWLQAEEPPSRDATLEDGPSLEDLDALGRLIELAISTHAPATSRR